LPGLEFWDLDPGLGREVGEIEGRREQRRQRLAVLVVVVGEGTASAIR
jgi:hypothetical protein